MTTSKSFFSCHVKRKRAVQDTDTFIRVLTSIPNIDKHDANSVMFYFSSNKTSIFDSYLTLLPCACVILTASRLVLLTHVTFWLQLYQAIGSIDATAKTSKEDILANTDLSADKTDILCRFFQDPEFYLSPRFN